MRAWLPLLALCLTLALSCNLLLPSAEKQEPRPQFLDLSLLVAPEYPCTWPTFPRFQINPYEPIGPLSPYNSEILTIDGNTGTQLDVPTHSVTPPDSGLPNAGP